MMRIYFLVLLGITITTLSYGNDLVCSVKDNERRDNVYNWPESLPNKDLTNKHFFTYETVRGDCHDGYAFEIEAYGPGLAFTFDELIYISCPFVTNFRGTYGGIKAHFSFIGGFDMAAYAGPGVCFITGLTLSFGFGASAGVLKIVHRYDNFTPKVEPKTPTIDEKPGHSDEVPEERKGE